MKDFLLNGLMLCAIVASGKNPILQNFNIQYGLPSNTVYAVYEDSKKYLWFCTESGVSKYDGQHFESFSLAEGIPDADVFNVFEDKKGRLWFYTLNGKVSFYKDGRIFNPENNELCRKLSMHSLIHKIVEVNDIIYFISGNDGIKTLSKGKIKHLNFPHIRSAAVLNDTLIIWGLHGSKVLSGYTSTIREHSSRSTQYFKSVEINGQLLVLRDNEIHRFNAALDTLPQVVYRSKDHNTLFMNIALVDNEYLLGSTTGLHVLDRQSWLRKEHMLQGIYITHVLKDFENGIWLSSMRNGSYYVKSIHSTLESVLPELLEKCVYVTSMDRRQTIWIGLDENTVMTIDSMGKVSKLFIPSPTTPRLARITKIVHYENHSLIFGKLFLARVENGKVTQTLGVGGNDFLIDSSGTIWVASTVFTNDGFMFKNGSMKVGDRSFVHATRSNKIEKIGSDIVIGTNSGAYFFLNRKVEKITAVGDASVVDISEHFLLTMDGCVYKKDEKGYSRYKDYKDYGSPPLFYCMFETADKIYLGSGRGLYEIDKKDTIIYHFPQTANLAIRDIYGIDNLLYLGTEQGLFQLAPFNNQLALSPPVLNIQHILINGVEAPIKDAYRLNAGQNTISIQYIGISYQSKPGYAYSINGKEWINSTSPNLLLNLDPGEYSVRISCTNNAGELYSNRVIKEIQFNIAAPLYLRPWFIALIILAFAALVYLIYTLNLRRVKTKHLLDEHEKEQILLQVLNEKTIMELEHKALRMQMNPHFIFNAINTIKGFYIEGKFRDASKYIDHFSKLLRSILETPQSLVTLERELTILEKYVAMAKMRFPDLKYKVHLEEGLDPKTTLIPNLLIQPFVENAIIHGLSPKLGKGNVSITIKRDSDVLIISIKDDGVGLIKSKGSNNPKSISIDLTRQRLNILNNMPDEDLLVVNSLKEGGVEVTIKTKYETL